MTNHANHVDTLHFSVKKRFWLFTTLLLSVPSATRVSHYSPPTIPSSHFSTMPHRSKLNVLTFRPDRKPNVGERIAIYWEEDQRFYPGQLHSVKQDGSVVVHYDDGEIETLDLDNEIWDFACDPSRYLFDPPNQHENGSDSDKEDDHNSPEDKNGTGSEDKDRDRNHTEDIHLGVQDKIIPDPEETAQQETEVDTSQKIVRSLSKSAREGQEPVTSARNTELLRTRLENASNDASTPNTETSQARSENTLRASASVYDDQFGPMARDDCNRNEGQALTARQEGNEPKKQKTQKVPKTQETQHADQTLTGPQTRNQQQTQNQHRVQDVLQEQDQQQTLNEQQIQGTHSAQHAPYEQYTPGRDGIIRVKRPLLVGSLPPVKKYACIQRLKQSGCRNEDLLKEMPYDELMCSFKRSND